MCALSIVATSRYIVRIYKACTRRLCNLSTQEHLILTWHVLGMSGRILESGMQTEHSACAQELHPGCQVHVVSVDVSDFATLERTLRSLQEQVGPVDVAVCNAGMCIPKKLIDQELSETEMTMKV
jgi:NAD(P)-dependent dehydrogenase (short-subunit alcohol dehydrogenase family)